MTDTERAPVLPPVVRLTASSITDGDLDALYGALKAARAEVHRQVTAKAGIAGQLGNALADLATVTAERDELRDDRDRARGIAVALENELAAIRRDRPGIAALAALVVTAAAEVRDERKHHHIAAEENARLRAELAALAADTPSTGYCPACGRGDCAPGIREWQHQYERAATAEAALTDARRELAERDRLLSDAGDLYRMHRDNADQARRELAAMTHAATVNGDAHRTAYQAGEAARSALDRVRAEVDRIEAACTPADSEIKGAYLGCLRHVRAALDGPTPGSTPQPTTARAAANWREALLNIDLTGHTQIPPIQPAEPDGMPTHAGPGVYPLPTAHCGLGREHLPHAWRPLHGRPAWCTGYTATPGGTP